MSTPEGGGRKTRARKKGEGCSLRDGPVGVGSDGGPVGVIPRSAPVAMALVCDQIIREVSDSFCGMLLHGREELVGADIGAVYAGAGECKRVSGECEGAAAGAVVTVETQWRRKDGEMVDVLLSAALADAGDRSRGTILSAIDVTTRKRDEEALRRSEAKFRSLFLNSKDAMVTAEPPDWRFTSCNPALLRVFGARTEAEFTAHYPWTLSPERQPDGRSSKDKVGEVIDRVMREGSVQFEWTHRRLNGELFPTEVLLTRAERDGERFVVATIRDLSERRRAEEERRVIEGLLDLAPAAITIHDPDGKHLYANQQCLRMHGYSREEFMALNLHELDVPESAALIEGRVRQLEGGGELPFEVRHRRKDGSEFPLIVHARMARWGERDVVLSVAHDITALKQAEAALRESEHCLREVSANLPGVVYQFVRRPDGAFCFHFVSEGASQLLGLPITALTDSAKVFNNVHPDDLPGLLASIDESARAMSRWKHEFRIVVETGEVRWIQGMSNPDLLVDGSIRWNGVLLDVTERKQAEDALRMSERRLQQATEAAHIGVWDWDIPRNELVWDDSMYRLYGVRREDFSGAYDAWFRCVHPDDKAAADREVQAALRGEKEYAPEFRVLLPDGSVRFIQAASQTLRDKDGKPLRMIGANIDVTERKKAERLLQESERRFRSLSDGSLEGILIHADGIVLDANAAFVRLLGYERPEEIVGRNAVEVLVAPESRQKIRDRMRLGDELPTEIVGVRRDGTRFAVEVQSRSTNYMGRDARIVCCRDITDRKRMENALRESESTLRSVFRAVPVGICIMKDRLFTSANEYWVQGFGRPGESIAGTSPRGLYETREEFERVGRELYGPLSDHGLTTVETRLRRNDGVFRDVVMTAAPVSGNDPSAGVVVVVFDVTERKQAEEALRASESTLRSVLRATPVGVCIVKDRVIKSANERWFRDLGYSEEEAIGKNTRQLYESDGEYERVGRDLYADLWTHGPTTTETQMRRRDGTLRDVVLTAAAIRPDDPSAGIVAAFFDVTERKQAEAARSEALARFEGFAEASQYGMGMADLEGRIVYVNPTLMRMLGEQSPADCVGKHFHSTYHSEDTARRLRDEAIPAILRDGQWCGEIELVTREGRRVPADANCFVIRDKGGAPRYLASILTDITERKRAEQELRASEAQLSSALRMARAGHWEYDVASDTFTVSDNFYGIFGTTAEQVGGYRMSSADYARRFCHPDDRHMVAEETRAAIETDDPRFTRQLEHRVLLLDGTVGHIAVRFSIVKDSQGRTVKTYGVNQNITERKRMEAERERSTALLMAALAQSPAGILIADAPDVTIRWANAAALSIRGSTELPLTGIEVAKHAAHWQVFRADGTPYRSEDLPLSRAVLKGEIIRNEEAIIRNENEEDRWVSANAAPVRDRDGSIIAGIVVFQDVTNLKKARESLAEREALWRTAFEYAPYAIAINRMSDGVYMDVNPAFERLSGLTPAEIIGRTHAEVVAVDETDALRRAVEQLDRTGRVENAEITTRTRDGGQRHVLFSSATFQQAGGRSCVTMTVDISDRKLIEERLRQSEERFRELAELLPQTVFEMDTTGRLTFVNQQSFAMFGRDPSDFDRGLSALDMIAPSDRARAAERVSALMSGDASGTGDYTAQRKDGTTFPVTVYSVPFRHAGVVRGLRGIVVDITDRKHAEEATARLQDQLRQAAKMEAIGRLAGGVAHDFNNLLTPILGYADIAMIQLGEKHSLYQEISQIRRSAERAAALTRQLLTFSRRQVLQPRALDLNAILRDMDKMLRRLIGEDVRLSLVFGDDLWTFVADPSQMEQVVMNLAVNARDAMPEGGTLTVRTENVSLDAAAAERIGGVSPDRYVLLSVSDTGCGMDEETIGRIFEPFFTTKAEGHGTGLGLATVYGIVQQSGGGIRVESERGKGSTFLAYFPAPVLPPASEASPPAETGSAEGTGTILVVEDAEMVRNMVQLVLTSRGYTVLTAANADEALAASRAHGGTIDLLLTDVVLPGAGGAQVAAMLRKERPSVKVLYMSGYTDDAMTRRGIEEEGAPLVHKPFSASELHAQVRRQLAKPSPGTR